MSDGANYELVKEFGLGFLKVVVSSNGPHLVLQIIGCHCSLRW